LTSIIEKPGSRVGVKRCMHLTAVFHTKRAYTCVLCFQIGNKFGLPTRKNVKRAVGPTLSSSFITRSHPRSSPPNNGHWKLSRPVTWERSWAGTLTKADSSGGLRRWVGLGLFGLLSRSPAPVSRIETTILSCRLVGLVHLFEHGVQPAPGIGRQGKNQ